MFGLRPPLNRVCRDSIACDYDPGTNDRFYVSGGLSNLANGKTGLLSLWFRVDGGDGSAMYMLADNTGLLTSRLAFGKTTGNKLYCALRGLVATNLYGEFESVSTFLAAAGWHHVIASWNLATATIQMYIDGSSDISILTNADGTIGYTTTGLFSLAGLSGGGNEWNGDLAEVWFNDEYLDISVAANREKFRSAAGAKVDLGTNGATPTGNTPCLYLPYGGFTNMGNGGSTIMAASSSPTLITDGPA